MRMDRIEKALASVDLTGRGLEIGPSYNPLVTKASGARIETVDHDDHVALRAKYQAWGIPQEKIDCIEPVDHIWQHGSLLDVIPGRGVYDYILASHFIEHTVDLVRFLNDCEALLTDCGRLSLIVPDKRFCFDRFQPLSTVGDVVDGHYATGKYHPVGALLDHQAYGCRLDEDGPIAWSIESARRPVSLQFPNLEGASDVIEAARAQASYQDTHRWKFTPGSFELLVSDLARLGYHQLGKVSSYPTEGFEFFVTLGKDVSLPDTDRLQVLLRIEEELAVVPPSASEEDALRADVGRLEAECRKLRAELDARGATPTGHVSAWLREKYHEARSRFRRS
jgi:hypothetical protein